MPVAKRVSDELLAGHPVRNWDTDSTFSFVDLDPYPCQIHLSCNTTGLSLFWLPGHIQCRCVPVHTHTSHLDSAGLLCEAPDLGQCPTLKHCVYRARHIFHGWRYYSALGKGRSANAFSLRIFMHSLMLLTSKQWEEASSMSLRRPFSATGDKWPNKTFRNLGYWRTWISYAALFMWEGDTVIWSWGRDVIPLCVA